MHDSKAWEHRKSLSFFSSTLTIWGANLWAYGWFPVTIKRRQNLGQSAAWSSWRTVKGLRSYSTCKLVSKLATVSCMLAGHLRLLGQTNDFIISSNSSSWSLCLCQFSELGSLKEEAESGGTRTLILSGLCYRRGTWTQGDQIFYNEQ